MEQSGEAHGEYSVVQWFPNGQYEYPRRNVDDFSAFRIAKHYCTSVGAQMGTTVRVMIEDGGGFCVFEWNRDEGVIFPEEFKGMFKGGDVHAR